MQYRKYFAVIFLLLAGCTQFEDADLTERRTFVHFYSSATNFGGLVAELDNDGGYILSGEVRHDNGLTDALIIKTDARGRKVWEKLIPKGVVKSIKRTQNGYILAGDSIQLNPNSPEISELVNAYASLMLMDSQGNILAKQILTDSTSTLTVDYHGDAVTIDGNGDIVMLGSFRVPGEHESSFVSAFPASDISDSLWWRSLKSQDHDFINCNTLHVKSGSDLVWASNTFSQLLNVSREFLSVSYVVPASTYKNNSVYGESDPRNHSVEDMQKSPVGYCAVGTYSETNGLNANIYFIRIDANGMVIPESAKYIDGVELMLNNRIMERDEKTLSDSFDEGLAIISTDDGFVLACAMTSTPTVGNGGKDILLVKLDPFGNLLWKKLLGGTGDEVISSIRETPDKGLLLFGTNTINGLSSMMLLKTDANGEIKD